MSEPEKFTILSNVIFTRNLILRSFCGIYLAAFLSFYIQAEGKHLSITSISPGNRYCVVASEIASSRSHTYKLQLFSGLFSHVDGIVPADIEPIKGTFLHDKFMSFIERPSWIRILKYFEVATFPSIEIISLLGTFIAFFGFVSSRFCILPAFALLWTFYYSLVDITQMFHQQADDLLLEAGLICILLAPGLSLKRYGVSDNVMLQLMRWILFR